MTEGLNKPTREINAPTGMFWLHTVRIIAVQIGRRTLYRVTAVKPDSTCSSHSAFEG
jgi:hypothetical protein